MELLVLEKKLGIVLKNKNLLKQALTHRSFLNEAYHWPVGHNERLEFLGDAVIQFVISTFLFELFPSKPEGELTELRASMVCTTTLASVGEELKLYDHLCMSKGERRDEHNGKRERLTASAFEALTAAVYLDQGYPGAIKFLRIWLAPRIREAVAKKRDAKSTIQNKAQGMLGVTPTYQVLKETGLDHNKEFLVGVYFGPTLIAQGKGLSKRLAEEQAAQAALRLKGWDTASTT